MRASGTIRTNYLECIDSRRNIWKIRWDFKKEEDGSFSFEEKTLNYKPSLEKMQDLIYDWYNKLTDKAILEGFTWKDMSIWLSSENLFNYKAAFDLAIQTQGASLPIKFKFGTTKNPIYYTFEDINDLTDFYMSAMTYINNTLDLGWQQKDNIDWNKYK